MNIIGLFWFPPTYEEAISDAVMEFKLNGMSQKVINFFINRIQFLFNKESMTISLDMLEKMWNV
jgi:hypothetical protein